MIKVSVLYPNTAGSRFECRIPQQAHTNGPAELRAALMGTSVEQGLGGVQPGSPPAYVAMGHLLFESTEAIQQSSDRTPRPS